MEGSGTVRRPRLMVPTNLEMIIVGRDIVLRSSRMKAAYVV